MEYSNRMAKNQQLLSEDFGNYRVTEMVGVDANGIDI